MELEEANFHSCKAVCELCPGDQIGTFSAVDYVLFAAVLVVSAGIGVFYVVKEYLSVRNATADDVLMGGRDIGIFPIAMSLMASFMSAITVLGTPTEMYNNNTSYWIAGLAMIPTVITTNHVFLPFFHDLSLTSAYEYLERRFNRATRVCASLIFILNMLLYMGVVLYAPALALNQVTGLSLELSIVSIGIVCTFYTALGGLRAVVWTDTFQTFVVMAGLIAVTAQGSKDLGGIDNVWNIAYNGGRIFFLDWSGDPTTRHSVWALLIGSFVGQLTIYAANQTMIQRYLAIKDPRNSQKALYLSLPLTLILSTLVCVVGIVIYATYHSCDPYILGHVHARDQLLPFLVMDKLTFLPGLSGLFVACIFSASLSSISSGLNALAIVILEDIVKIFWEMMDIEPSPTTIARLAKLLGLLCGGVVIGVAFISQFLGQTVLQIMLSIFGMVGGPLLGLFISGLFIPWINEWGALCGLIVSAVLTFWVGVGGTVLVPLPEIKHVSADMCLNFNTTCGAQTIANNLTLTENMTSSTILTTTMSTSLGINGTTSMSSQIDDDSLWIYHLSYLWYALFAVLISLITGTIVTIITSILTDFNDPDNVDPTLIHRVVDRVCCYLPMCCKRIHRFEMEKPGRREPYNVKLEKSVYVNASFEPGNDTGLRMTHLPNGGHPSAEIVEDGTKL
ncbi:sodium-coupled monocarboxylate transporter 1-like [Mercenaria mercenaria]|uniref:sodium-coupled monocarboxylate transporter 1-like n=1 Tax=Mercenaria mercenaria TaxID=6596 RepID=UPI00234E7AD9|nr:sodium-coupled monocarboxylate transporter 1-like [Mercenaria mercenaria]